MNRLIATLLSSACMLATAQAADYEIVEAPEAPIVTAKVQMYVAARLGISSLRETQFALDNSILDGATRVGTTIGNTYDDANLGGFVAIGFDNREGMRAEIEAGYSEFQVDSHVVKVLPARFEGNAAFGSANVTTVMGNAYYDVAFGKVRPYLGAGVGVARIDFDNYGIDIPAGGVLNLPAGPLTALNEVGYGFAWQIGAGVAYDLTDNIAIELGYRLSGVQSLDFAAVDGTEYRQQLLSHSVTTGVRYSF